MGRPGVPLKPTSEKSHTLYCRAWREKKRNGWRARSLALGDRMDAKIDRDGPVARLVMSNCWTWVGARNRSGYGSIGLGMAVTALAHRVAYAVERGPIPNGLQVIHHCDNPACVRVSHLSLGTAADNMADKVSKARHLSVPRGTRHCNANLTEDMVRDIRNMYDGGLTVTKIASLIKRSTSNVSRICRRMAWLHVK